jgi:hypothetical protein
LIVILCCLSDFGRRLQNVANIFETLQECASAGLRTRPAFIVCAARREYRKTISPSGTKHQQGDQGKTTQSCFNFSSNTMCIRGAPHLTISFLASLALALFTLTKFTLESDLSLGASDTKEERKDQ